MTVDSRYQDNDSGTFQHLTPGFAITFRDALVMMIIVSDNTCTGTVVDLWGWGDPAPLRVGGMSRTVHRFGIPPRLPADHGWSKSPPPPRATRDCSWTSSSGGPTTRGGRAAGFHPGILRLGLDILSWQKLKARLPSLLPLGTKVAHKTGTGSRGYMDAGIVYKEGRPLFIFTAYTDGVPAALPDGMPGFAAANQVIGRMARLAWDDLGAGG